MRHNRKRKGKNMTQMPESIARAAGIVRDWMRPRVEKGVTCPCCQQFAKVYTRKFYSTMAYRLLQMYRKYGQEFVHVKEMLGIKGPASSGDFPSKLIYWGLVEEMPNDDPKKKDSGKWRITNKGVNFIHERITIKSHIRLYDSKLLGFLGDDVFISDCLGKKFNYNQLMGLDENGQSVMLK
jgi:hypothetical protein